MISQKNKELIKTMFVLLVVVIISMIVHEFGHVIVGLLYGYDLTRFGIGIVNGMPALYVTFSNTVPINWLVCFSGGLFQAGFMMIFAKKYPELILGAIVCIGYGVFEVLMY